MQKFVNILEKNVQWVALALGGLFMAWMLYSNIASSPVTVELTPGKSLAPGLIDAATREGPLKKLKVAMNFDPPNFAIVVPNFVQESKTALAGVTGYETLQLPWPNLPPSRSSSVVPIPGGQPEAPIQQAVVKALPVLPPATDLKTSGGLSNVLIPVPGAPAGGAPVAANSGVDKAWNTVSGVVVMDDVVKAFKAAGVPDQLMTTCFLRVELVRQEQLPSGNWGNDQVIAPLQNVTLLPMPQEAATLSEKGTYQQWAEKNQPDLLQPPFYQVLQADKWRVPGTEPGKLVQAANRVFDPAKFDGNYSALSPEERKALDDYRKNNPVRRPPPARNPPRSGSGSGPPSGPPSGFPFIPGAGGRSSPPSRPGLNDADRPNTLLAQANGEGPNFGPGSAPPFGPGGVPYGGGPPFGGPPFGQPPNANPNVTGLAGSIPNGSFDPRAQANVTFWAHDDSVQPGHTYRYMVRYYIKSPVFLSNVCDPKLLSDQMSLKSPDSKWTDAISVKSETNFFFVNATTHNTAKFEIYRWKNGTWQMQSVEAGPGDMVGKAQGSGNDLIDFTTGLTVVEVRQDPQHPDNRQVLLVSDNGQVIQHDLAHDTTDPGHKQLNDQVQSSVAKPVAVNGG